MELCSSSLRRHLGGIDLAELALVLPRAYCFAIAIIVHHRYRAESLRTSKDLKGQCHINLLEAVREKREMLPRAYCFATAVIATALCRFADLVRSSQRVRSFERSDGAMSRWTDE
jgi:hypothetical protein